ncbi:mitochondrial orthinine aminotransferase [Andalucia godoyi]|uniref:Ornithine aminotransferase n=1 Tax=Andalucia godoyi TaxID=505711 RepID=A0A8K0AH96_ANDGO|nr:Ornithine aminotransferase car2 [Andalucia godoyi]KAF0852876.1 mitochondrial orthinine aminotransferase [Andalucia godoyi]|eukprot:ANDGO_02671.mRNA.1 mitochondrial orthinine aminotransferase (ornithine--oxo-acid transaminase)/alanine-glyoxylate aminotransferase (AGAT)
MLRTSSVLLRKFASEASKDVMRREYLYSAHNYHPLPVVFSRAAGVHVWDPEGRRYYDFLSAYSAVNQGHSHPRIVAALTKQAQTLALSSRAFYNDKLGEFAEFATKLFGFDMLLPMNTGAEGVETAVKLARRWAYRVKKVPHDRAIIISACGSFHGRTQTAMALSSDPSMVEDFGPLLPGVVKVEYNSLESLEDCLKTYGSLAAGFIVEPIQGEAGVFVPDEGYIAKAKKLCQQHNVLFIADEIQTGVARTGKMLAVDHEGVKPDILILGKAVSGGLYPVSLVLCNTEIMLTIKPGEHGSTFGGNPLGCAVAKEALQVVLDEKLAEKSQRLGEMFRTELRNLKSPAISLVRGKGLLNAIVVDHDELAKTTGNTAWELCLLMASRGLLAKPTHDHIVRLAPPLVITDEQLRECVQIIKQSVEDLATIPREKIPNPEKGLFSQH